MPIDTADAIRELADRTTITEVLHAYAQLVDERDFTGAAALFTGDCVAEYGIRESDVLYTSASVGDWLTRQLADGTPTSHHISNVQIRFADADHAETTSYVYAWHGAPGETADPVVLARYVDSLERSAVGWRIGRRQMFAHGLIGFPDGIFRPLARRDDGAGRVAAEASRL